jgi:hypothetical protein
MSKTRRKFSKTANSGKLLDTWTYEYKGVEDRLANLNACNWLPAPELEATEETETFIESKADIITDEEIYQ